eukprot:10930797-Lingulodinium_polyedra.AAC.1
MGGRSALWDSCPIMGKRAPELAAGEATQALQGYYAASRQDVVADAAFQLKGRRADLDAIVRDWDNAV